MTPPLCSVDGCGRPTHSSKWCSAHYRRWLRHGDVLADIPIEKRRARGEYVLPETDENHCQHCADPMPPPRMPVPPYGRYCSQPTCSRARQAAYDKWRTSGRPYPPRACTECGAPMPEDRSCSWACSDKCQAERKRRNTRNTARKKALNNPNLARQRYAIMKERANVDPEYAARIRQWRQTAAAKTRERYATDPSFRERQAERAEEWRSRNAERLRAYQHEWYMANAERIRTEDQERYFKWRASLTADQLAELREQDRKRAQQRRAHQRLANIQRIGAELERRLNK